MSRVAPRPPSGWVWLEGGVWGGSPGSTEPAVPQVGSEGRNPRSGATWSGEGQGPSPQAGRSYPQPWGSPTPMLSNETVLVDAENHWVVPGPERWRS